MAKKRDDGRKIYTTDVLVQLDDAAAVVLIKKAQKIDERADDLLDQLKKHLATEKAKIATLRAEAARDRTGAADGEIMVPMKVYEEWEGSQAMLYRADNKEKVGERALTAEERQVDAFPGIDDGGALDADEGAGAGSTFGPADPPGAAAKPKRGRKS